jgi:hypothetical protein
VQYEQALGSYRKGVETAEKYLGPTHAITVTLRNSSIAAKRAILNKDPKVSRLLKQYSTLSGRQQRRPMLPC